ncbi:PIN domain-containing protein [Streptomyces chiangmaiensis]|uniref:hypothetical protein n=1 Tax=Streptomyces chiangmaiensis TaxID=766497 RepID=UPI0036269EDC
MRASRLTSRKKKVAVRCRSRRADPGTAEHLAALPGITVLDLDLPAALAVAQQNTWAAAHSQYAGQPTPERPDGAIIATTEPDRWIGEPVRVLDLNP